MPDGINTLQEFMLRTKGIVYILAFAYMFGFIGFWRFLNQKKNRY
ncbi:sulfate respiration complex protein HmcD [Gemmatimonadota bacterium]